MKTSLFENIYNESRTYPKEGFHSNGQPKRIPLVLKFIFDNPGATKQEVLEFCAAHGFTSVGTEMFSSFYYDGMVNIEQDGRKNRYYPNEDTINYLKSINFITEAEAEDKLKNQNTETLNKLKRSLVNKISGTIYESGKTYWKKWDTMSKDEKAKFLNEVVTEFLK